jgi:hypothetical protein
MERTVLASVLLSLFCGEANPEASFNDKFQKGFRSYWLTKGLNNFRSDNDSTRMSRLEALHPISGNGEVKYVEWNHEVTADVLCEFLLTNESDAVSASSMLLWGSLLTSRR